MSDVDKIVSYIKANNILTVCTEQNAIPWAASCFYAFDKDTMEFFVLTSLETRHGAEMQNNNQVAGTVSSQQVNVAKIRGLQFSGTALLLDGEPEKKGRSLYYKRFPLARVHAAPLWSIRLEAMKYTDNSFGFGTKLFWERS
ncbi:MAG TPA: pyridoxamine 5'-phosphate oxidase family protein [Telmatospirillum sp.]|nr:pyridoxamine 5'-phosphate oxidase family protein [Telmatospirillum sp.]